MEIYKLVGYILVMVGCVGLGICYSNRFKGNISNLKKLCYILEQLKSQVRYGRSTLPECCFCLGERLEEPYRSAFLEIYEKTGENTGESFGEVSSEVLGRVLTAVILGKEEKDLFVSCFANPGFEDNEMQLRNVERIENELDRHLHVLMKESPSKCKLALCLGIMSGLLIVILFL